MERKYYQVPQVLFAFISQDKYVYYASRITWSGRYVPAKEPKYRVTITTYREDGRQFTLATSAILRDLEPYDKQQAYTVKEIIQLGAYSFNAKKFITNYTPPKKAKTQSTNSPRKPSPIPHKPKEIIVYVDREVEVPSKIEYRDKIVEKVVYRTKEVITEKIIKEPVYVDKEVIIPRYSNDLRFSPEFIEHTKKLAHEPDADYHDIRKKLGLTKFQLAYIINDGFVSGTPRAKEYYMYYTPQDT